MYIVISAELVDANSITDVIFPNPNSSFDVNNLIFIPESFIQHRSMTTGKPFPVHVYAFNHIVIIRHRSYSYCKYYLKKYSRYFTVSLLYINIYINNSVKTLHVRIFYCFTNASVKSQ